MPMIEAPLDLCDLRSAVQFGLLLGAMIHIATVAFRLLSAMGALMAAIATAPKTMTTTVEGVRIVLRYVVESFDTLYYIFHGPVSEMPSAEGSKHVDFKRPGYFFMDLSGILDRASEVSTRRCPSSTVGETHCPHATTTTYSQLVLPLSFKALLVIIVVTHDLFMLFGNAICDFLIWIMTCIDPTCADTTTASRSSTTEPVITLPDDSSGEPSCPAPVVSENIKGRPVVEFLDDDQPAPPVEPSPPIASGYVIESFITFFRILYGPNSEKTSADDSRHVDSKRLRYFFMDLSGILDRASEATTRQCPSLTIGDTHNRATTNIYSQVLLPLSFKALLLGIIVAHDLFVLCGNVICDFLIWIMTCIDPTCADTTSASSASTTEPIITLPDDPSEEPSCPGHVLPENVKGRPVVEFLDDDHPPAPVQPSPPTTPPSPERCVKSKFRYTHGGLYRYMVKDEDLVLKSVKLQTWVIPEGRPARCLVDLKVYNARTRRVSKMSPTEVASKLDHVSSSRLFSALLKHRIEIMKTGL